MIKVLYKFWYTFYPLVFSAITAIVLYWGLTPLEILSLLAADGMEGALGAIITFTSIIVGFIGVLLTSIVSVKRESELIQYFLSSVSKKAFTRLVSCNILSGIGTALSSAVLFCAEEIYCILLRRSVDPRIICVMFCVWAFLITYFVLSIYKLIKILLTMLIRSDEKREKLEDPNSLSDEAAKALRAKHTKPD